jgi:hypothetical protein
MQQTAEWYGVLAVSLLLLFEELVVMIGFVLRRKHSPLNARSFPISLLMMISQIIILVCRSGVYLGLFTGDEIVYYDLTTPIPVNQRYMILINSLTYPLLAHGYMWSMSRLYYLWKNQLWQKDNGKFTWKQKAAKLLFLSEWKSALIVLIWTAVEIGILALVTVFYFEFELVPKRSDELFNLVLYVAYFPLFLFIGYKMNQVSDALFLKKELICVGILWIIVLIIMTFLNLWSGMPIYIQTLVANIGFWILFQISFLWPLYKSKNPTQFRNRSESNQIDFESTHLYSVNGLWIWLTAHPTILNSFVHGYLEQRFLWLDFALWNSLEELDTIKDADTKFLKGFLIQEKFLKPEAYLTSFNIQAFLQNDTTFSYLDPESNVIQDSHYSNLLLYQRATISQYFQDYVGNDPSYPSLYKRAKQTDQLDKALPLIIDIKPEITKPI